MCGVVWCSCFWGACVRTDIAEKRVMKMEPKYMAVKGSRGPETRCLAYVIGPIRTAHDVKNRTEPNVHLRKNAIRCNMLASIIRSDSYSHNWGVGGQR